MRYFGKKKREAVKIYRNFVEGIDVKTLENPGINVVGGFILGDTGFIDWVKETFLSRMEEEKEIPELGKLKPKPSMERIVEAVGTEFGCNEGDILVKGRKKNKAGEIAVYIARDLGGLSCKDLGTYFICHLYVTSPVV